jgi:cell division protease FtsH
MDRWHADIRNGISIDAAVASTDGYSFAEIDELKNLLIMHRMDAAEWDWGWALEQFEVNRKDLNGRRRRRVGFGQAAEHFLGVANGA